MDEDETLGWPTASFLYATCNVQADGDGKHAHKRPALQKADNEDDADDAKGEQGQLLAKLVHVDLQRRLSRLHVLQEDWQVA